MRASTKRFLSLLVSLVFLMGAFFVYAIFLKPTYAEVNELRGDLRSKTQFYEEQQEIIASVQTLLAQYESVSTLRNTVSQALPSEEDYPTLFNQINGLVNTAGLLLDSINVDAMPFGGTTSFVGADVPTTRTLQLSLRLVGPYDGMKRLIEVLENNFRVMDIESITVNPGSDTSQNYSYDFVINTYYQSL